MIGKTILHIIVLALTLASLESGFHAQAEAFDMSVDIPHVQGQDNNSSNSDQDSYIDSFCGSHCGSHPLFSFTGHAQAAIPTLMTAQFVLVSESALSSLVYELKRPPRI